VSPDLFLVGQGGTGATDIFVGRVSLARTDFEWGTGGDERSTSSGTGSSQIIWCFHSTCSDEYNQKEFINLSE
jgi:hypothetical protein